MRSDRLLALVAALLLTGCTPPPDADDQNAAVTPEPSPPPSATATAASAPPPAATPLDIPAISGTYRVTGVGIGSGVGAFAKDDPAYMARTLTIAADRIAWGQGAPAGTATLDDRCAQPALQPLDGAAAETYRTQFADQLASLAWTGGKVAAIECVEGNWGPEAAGGAILFVDARGGLAMSWYDGIVLRLTR